MSQPLRPIAAPFVVAPPAGVSVRTRLGLTETDAGVLREVGAHLGSLAGRDLARRCGEGALDRKGEANSRAARKQELTGECSSRWAGAITRTSNDAWALAERNLQAERISLTARVKKIRRRLAAPVGGGAGRVRGYATAAERWQKQQRLQHLWARLAEVEDRLGQGRMSMCRGGRRLARTHHHLEAAGMEESAWREAWRAERSFITADGEADKNWGNETIRWNPEEGFLEIKLPGALSHLANRPHGRYRLSCLVSFPYRGDEVAAQAATGAVRYDISYDSARRRWYLDASWRPPRDETPTLDELRRQPMLAVDVNADHLAGFVISPDGNPTGPPINTSLELAGLPATRRDGLLRAAITDLLWAAKAYGCGAVVVENLDFQAGRSEGREHSRRRPSRGRRGRAFRRLVAGIPTGRFRHRLVQMATNVGLAVIAVDAAYTSRWGVEHWLGPLRQQFSPSTISGHHAAAVVIGRRGLGQRARRRERCASTRPEDRQERATNSALQPTSGMPGLSGPRNRKPGDRKTRGQPLKRHKTRPADRASPGHQGGEDRSRRPETAMSYSLLR